MDERNLHEKIEWLNYWIEDADADKERILIIGDSVARQYRKTLNEVVRQEGYAVDLIATSRNMLDNVLNGEIENYLIMAGYRYNAILYGLGAHHGYWIRCAEDKLSRELYKESVLTQVNILKKYTDTIIFLAGTPEREVSDDGESIEHHNLEILERNQILKEIAQEYGQLYFDLFKFIKENEIDKYTDNRHFDVGSYYQVAYKLASIILGEVNNINIHAIKHIYELKKYLEKQKKNKKQIYIYGNSKRGNILKRYIFNEYKYYISGFIVSNEFYVENEDVFLLEDIDKNTSAVIVALEAYEIWYKLDHLGVEWVKLDRILYRVMDEILLAGSVS